MHIIYTVNIDKKYNISSKILQYFLLQTSIRILACALA